MLSIASPNFQLSSLSLSSLERKLINHLSSTTMADNDKHEGPAIQVDEPITTTAKETQATVPDAHDESAVSNNSPEHEDATHDPAGEQVHRTGTFSRPAQSSHISTSHNDDQAGHQQVTSSHQPESVSSEHEYVQKALNAIEHDTTRRD